MSYRPDLSSLRSFDHAAAGHEGVLTDEDFTVVVKPCTAEEIAFYESANARHPELAYFMPQFMGTLELNKSEDPTADVDRAPAQQQKDTPPSQTKSVPRPPDPLRLKGKAISTDTCIVLSAVTAGLKQPNVLDLKLGARLWADDAPQAKRMRLDKVSAETTSSSLGFRIAGMRVWQGEDHKQPQIPVPNAEDHSSQVEYDRDTQYLIYNKLYGRMLKTEDIMSGFETYFLVAAAEVGKDQALRLVRHIWREIAEIRDVLQRIESRMYSCSLLLVYEGDVRAYKQAVDAEDARLAETARSSKASRVSVMESRDQDHEGSEHSNENIDEQDGLSDSEEGDDEVEDLPRTFAVKLIDFAHADWAPGQGPDENILHGIRSVLDILANLEKKLET